MYSEISVGDNDTMGAIVAENANADLLIILSDIDVPTFTTIRIITS